MPLYKEDNYLIVHPGSEHTLFSFGLQDTIAPPQYKIPSVVYKQGSEFKAKNLGDLVEVKPIKGGKIVDVPAFNYLLKIILQSVVSQNPLVTINQIPLLLIVPSLSYSKSALELVTKFVVETLEITAFNILDLSLASTFGIGTISNSLVINIGHENTQITPVLNFQPIKFAGKLLSNVGGVTIDEEITNSLPNLTKSQINDFKSSGIFEVMNDAKTQAFYDNIDLKIHADAKNESEEVIDVAKIVSEIEKPEKEEKEEKQANNELEKNYFVDSNTGEKIWAGKERFQGTGRLINLIIDAIYRSLSQIPDIEKRQECYDNLIFTGATFKIPGLKQQLIIKLAEKYLITEEDLGGVNSTLQSYQQADEVDGESLINLPQVPHSIKVAKLPDYFPEWKKNKETWTDIYFLGAQIYAKQIFSSNSNHGKDLFIDSDVYEERGPQSIWDVSV